MPMQKLQTRQRPSEILNASREHVQMLVQRHKMTNLRVFGSVASGHDTIKSDIDLLVDLLPDATAFDLFDFHDALEDHLGVRVDLVTLRALSPENRESMLKSSVPI